jgi:DNA-binding NtrC family response regulator
VHRGAPPESRIESELFGHEKGAFTGATRAHRGYFEVAHTGTIFLDEVAEMPTNVQVRLLRVIQERAFQRLGSEHAIGLDIRIIAATNRDPSEEIAAKRLRSDLYYRLGVVTLAIPALRDRPEDIEGLARSFAATHATRMGRTIPGINRRAMDELVSYSWPGNVRELQNVVERLVLLTESDEIDIRDLPEELVGSRAHAGTADTGSTDEVRIDRTLVAARREVVDAFEHRYLDAVLRACQGRVGEAAKRAGVSPRALYAKMRYYGLRKEHYR